MSKGNVEVINVDLSVIKPYWRNPRVNDKTIDALVKSIERYGFNVPMVLDDKNVIVAGHARYRALQKLGYKSVPCVYTDLKGPELREFRVMDNRVQELADYDDEKLAVELSRIFDGTDLAAFFGTSLDRVLDISAFRDDEDDSLDIDFDAVTAGQTVEKPEKHAPRCPFCETEITKDHIIDDLEPA